MSSQALIVDSGEEKLRKLGYKQEFKRDFGAFENFAVSFSIISILTGITGSLGIAWNNGGPVSAVWGWVVVSFFTMMIGLAMAEIVSAVPSAGGPYFWSSVLSGRHGPFFSWVTGWFNLLGQVAVTASIVFTLTNHLASMILLGGGGAGIGYALTQGQLLGVYGGILVLTGLMNIFSTRIIAWLNAVSVVWHVTGAITLIVLIPAVARTHQTGDYVFRTFNHTDLSNSGISSNAYLFFVGMLMSQFTITGFDACAHMSEETRNADKSAAWAIVMAIGTSSVVGWGYILALLFSIQAPDDILLTDYDSTAPGSANGYISGQIMFDAFKSRYGHGGGGVVAMGIPAIAMFLCGMSSVTSNSRMIWSFACDKGLPASFIWSKVSRRTGTPMFAIVFAVVVAFLLGLPLLKSTVAFTAVVSISTIGLYISYAIPIFCRLTFGRSTFEKGPFNLGPFSDIIGWIAVLWVMFITVIFVLPTAYPVDSLTLNYAPVAVGIVLFGSIAWWLLPKIGARYWYKGAAGVMSEEEMAEAQGEIGMKNFVPLPKEV